MTGTVGRLVWDATQVLAILRDRDWQMGGVRLERVPARPMLRLDPDDLEVDEEDDEAKCNGCGGVVWLKRDGTGRCPNCNGPDTNTLITP